MTPTPATYVALNRGALRHNVAQVRSRLRDKSALCAVVKGNGYGHGAPQAARCCVDAGAAWLGVSTVAEGVALREAGLTEPALVFLPPLPEECEAAVEHDLTATVTRVEQVMELRREGERQGKRAVAHAYQDLGLGRLGPHDSLLDILEAAEPWPQVEVSGVYGHFGPPGSGVELDFLDWLRPAASLKVYAAMLAEAIRKITDRRLMFHVAASAMFLENPEHHFDLARVGSLLYGQYPDHVPQALRTLDLRETWELRSRIVEVHTVERGAKIGYGGEFVCRRETRVATVPVGLAHGLAVVPESVAGRWRFFAKERLRARSSRRGLHGHLLRARIGSREAPLIGRVSMDQCSLDVTDLPDADRGTEVVLPARRVTTNPQIPRVYEEG